MNIVPTFFSHNVTSAISYASRLYADWRIKPTVDEIRAYNQTDKVLLTFDDFASEATITKILSILRNEHVLAVFFLVGDFTNKNPQIVEKIKHEGHWIGNHTKTHANLLRLTDMQVRGEIMGGPSSTLLRPPYGKYDKRIRKIAKELGYKICYWDIDSADWQGINKEEIITRSIQGMHHGACILLHLNGLHTIEALPFLIKTIRDKGYELCNTGKELTYE